MAHPSDSHWQKDENRMASPAGSHIPNWKIPPFAVDSVPNPKSATLISDITY